MKKIIFFACLMILSVNGSTIFANKIDNKTETTNNAIINNKDNKALDEEVIRMKARVEEIKAIDKSKLSVTEKRELKKELKAIKENLRRDGTVLYISGSTLLIIILILIII